MYGFTFSFDCHVLLTISFDIAFLLKNTYTVQFFRTKHTDAHREVQIKTGQGCSLVLGDSMHINLQTRLSPHMEKE